MDAVILAAGNSKRFDGNKLLHEIKGKPMYRYILEHLQVLQCQGLIDQVVLVTQYEEIITYVVTQMPTFQVVRNDVPEMGISHSVALGIRKIRDGQGLHERACMFAVSDQPNMSLPSLLGFIKAYEANHQGIAICGHGNRMGNPVIFHEKYYNELENMEGDKGGKQVVMQHLDDTFLYQIPEVELEDIDVRSTDTRDTIQG